MHTSIPDGSRAHNKTPPPKVRAANPIVFPMHLIIRIPFSDSQTRKNK